MWGLDLRGAILARTGRLTAPVPASPFLTPAAACRAATPRVLTGLAPAGAGPGAASAPGTASSATAQPLAPCRSVTLLAGAMLLPPLPPLRPAVGLVPLLAPRSRLAILVGEVLGAGVVAALAVGETRTLVPAEMPMPPEGPGLGGVPAGGARVRTPAWRSAAARPRPALLALALPLVASRPRRRPRRLRSLDGGSLLGPLPRLLSPLLLLHRVGWPVPPP